MKITAAAVAATLAATSAGAVDSYQSLGWGNPDLSWERPTFADHTPMQPGVGDGVDRYHGLGNGNPDLDSISATGPTIAITPSSGDRAIYVGPGREL